jgi:hypothetical protein
MKVATRTMFTRDPDQRCDDQGRQNYSHDCEGLNPARHGRRRTLVGSGTHAILRGAVAFAVNVAVSATAQLRPVARTLC